MTRISRTRIIGAIIRKDLREYARDRFFVLVSALGLVMVVTIFWLLPDGVDESIAVGIRLKGLDGMNGLAAGTAAGADPGMEMVPFASAQELQVAVGAAEGEAERELDIGLEFPEDFVERSLAGELTTVKVYVRGGVPEEVRGAMASFVRELALGLAGHELPVTMPAVETLILGDDRAGNQVTLREKMRPLYAFMMLMMETMALGALVAAEVQSRTVTAIITTPARVSDFLAAKAILGTLIAFTEAILVMALIGALGNGLLVLVIALLLGAMLVTGFGLIAGASGRDYMGMMFFSLLFLVPLMIPAMATLFPGTASGWVQVLPSYGLVQAILGATAYGDSLLDVLPHLATLLAWCAVAFGAGLLILKRKVESL
jgi:ABC-2 type transport system permease protein